MHDKKTEIKILINKAELGKQDITNISTKRLGDYLREYSRLSKFVNDNKPLNLIRNIGLSYKKYFEFILICRYHRLDIESLACFNIDNVRVEVGEPSDTFKLVYKVLEEKETYFRWEGYKTIKFFDIKKEEVNDYLQETIFLLEYYKPWYFQLGHQSTYLDVNLQELQKLLKPSVMNNYPKANFTDPIYFYNEAVKRSYNNIEDEIAFLYYYKVIEYFFFINRKEEISSIIQDYLHDVDKLILKIDEVYKSDEKSCLSHIVKNNKLENQINYLIIDAYTEKLIPNNTQESFVNSIYSFRNSVAHGKGGNSFEIKTTNILKPDVKMISWNHIIKKFACICIVEFCYENKI